jgi:hypothetical protein
MAPKRKKQDPSSKKDRETPKSKKSEAAPALKDAAFSQFKDGRYKKIEYLEVLNMTAEDEHSYVFRVLIDSETFALKIVSFSRSLSLNAILS